MDSTADRWQCSPMSWSHSGSIRATAISYSSLKNDRRSIQPRVITPFARRQACVDREARADELVADQAVEQVQRLEAVDRYDIDNAAARRSETDPHTSVRVLPAGMSSSRCIVNLNWARFSVRCVRRLLRAARRAVAAG